MVYSKGPARGRTENTEGSPAMNLTENRIVTGLIAHLATSGYKLDGYRDVGSGEPMVKCGTAEAIKGIDSTGDAWLYFSPLTGQARRVRFIVGNDRDIISDWTLAPGGDDNAWNAAMDAYVDGINATA